MKPSTQPVRAVFYGRKSNDDRGELGESITQQRQWAVDTAAREGVVIVKEFGDQSVAGWDTARRSGFAEMLAFCKEQNRLGNPIEAIVCWAPNRFSRSDSLETSRFLCEFRDVGVSRMLTATKWIDFNRPEDRMLFGLEQEASAHRYSLDLSRVTTRGKRAAAEKGEWNGGKAPYGYKVENRKLVTNPDEAEHLKWLFATYAGTDISIRGLAERLYARGATSPAGNARWLAATIGKVLRNPLYLGDALFGRASYSPFASQEFAGTVSVKARRKPESGRPKPESEWVRVSDAHPALIDRATFDAVQVRLSKNQRRTSPRKTAPFALSGLLVCAVCGRNMLAETNHVKSGKKTHVYRVYTCVSYHDYGTASGCGRNVVDDALMVRAIVRKLAANFTAPETVAALRAAIERRERENAPTDRVGELETRVADLDRRIGKLVERMEDDLPEAAVEDVRNRLRALSNQRESVRGELAVAKAAAVASTPAGERVARIVNLVGNLEAAVTRADPALVSELLRKLLARVEVSFTQTKTKKRTRTAFARGLLYLNPEGWVQNDSKLVACVGAQAAENAEKMVAQLLGAPNVQVMEPPPSGLF